MGGVATGVFAFGGVAFGVVACAGCAVGLLSIAGCALGLVGAYGGVAIAPVALGGLTIGYYVLGGGGWGAHMVMQDMQAARHLLKMLNYIGLVMILVPMTILLTIPPWLQRRAEKKLQKP